MKLRYFLKPTNKPIEERLTSELVYAEVSNSFGSKIDGVAKYKKFQYSLEVYVKPHHFGIPKTKRGFTNYVYDALTLDKHKQHTAELRQAILDFENNIKQTTTYFKNEGVKPSAKEYKQKLEEIAGRMRGVKEEVTVLGYATKRLEKLKKLSGTGARGSKRVNTLENAQTLLTHLANYEEVRGVALTFTNLSERYWDLWDVVDGLIRGTYEVALKAGQKRKPINKNGLGTNTLIGYQLELRYICEDAISDKLDVSLSVSDKKLIHKRQKSSQQYGVTISDLLTIYKHTPSTPRLQKAKDYLIFSCLSGMRLQSVLDSINKPIQTHDKDGRNYKYLHTKQTKTATECHTPLFRPCIEIIERNGGKLPDFAKDSSTINTQLKHLYKEAGLTYTLPVTKHYYLEGAVTELMPVNKIISSHDCRRAFVTNLAELGVDTAISKLVVHPDRKEVGTTDLYNKLDNTKRANKFYDEVVKHLTDNELYRF